MWRRDILVRYAEKASLQRKLSCPTSAKFTVIKRKEQSEISGGREDPTAEVPKHHPQWWSSYRRALPEARLGPTNSRLVKTLGTAFSGFPQDVDPIRSVKLVQMKRRGEMRGLVGLTRYCCIKTGGSSTRGGPPTQTITFYSDLFDEISDRAAVGVVAHELAHAWLNEHDHPEASNEREVAADRLARRWGYGEYLVSLAAETETI